jgi:hypothetical protein
MDGGLIAQVGRRRRGAPRLLALLGSAALVLGGCASRRALDPAEWTAGDAVGYRLLTKDDFRASSSSGVWGNIAHGAEICSFIVPAQDHERTGAFRAVMNPGCSFWNKTGKVTTLGGLSAVSVIPFLPTQQPDWYVLQHEQIHFAIMEVTARRLSQQIAEMPAEQRTTSAIERAYRLALAQADERHAQFDAATSGTFDPQKLGAWVRALETEMRSLCGWEERCWVRHRTPLGWGD